MIGGDQSELSTHFAVTAAFIIQTEFSVAAGGQPGVCWFDWKNQRPRNRDCLRRHRGMIRDIDL